MPTGPDATLLRPFRRRYRGAWRPSDALAWLDDPRAVGPSGAPAPTRDLDRLRNEVYGGQRGSTAARRLAEATERLDAELAQARAARDAARRARGRSRAVALVALGVGAAGVVGAVGLGSAVIRSPGPTAEALVAPPSQGSRVWAAHGTGSLPSSPVLEAPGSPVVVALACRGRGAITVLVDQQDRRVVCPAGRVRTDTEYFVGSHGRFAIALSAPAPVQWALTVTAQAGG